jgi:hypothetical protein
VCRCTFSGGNAPLVKEILTLHSVSAQLPFFALN